MVVVKDGHLAIGMLADGDAGLTQGITWAVGLNLVDDIVSLNGEVFGERTGDLVGQDQVQVIRCEQGTTAKRRLKSSRNSGR